MPGFEYHRRENQRKSQKKSRNYPIISALFHEKDICLLVDTKMILKWAVHSVKAMTAAKLQKNEMRFIWGPHSKFSPLTYLEILIFEYLGKP